jgi:hypothetical protein
MAKTFSIVAIIALLMVFVSSNKPISVNPRSGDGVIVDKYYKPTYTTTVLIPSGKVLIPMTQVHPAIYGVTIRVSYNDYSYTTNYYSSQLYSEKKGTKVKVEWTEKVYKKKDGTLKTDISNVEVVGVYGK